MTTNNTPLCLPVPWASASPQARIAIVSALIVAIAALVLIGLGVSGVVGSLQTPHSIDFLISGGFALSISIGTWIIARCIASSLQNATPTVSVTSSERAIVPIAPNRAADQSMTTLVEEGKIEEACKAYLNTTYERKTGQAAKRPSYKLFTTRQLVDSASRNASQCNSRLLAIRRGKYRSEKSAQILFEIVHGNTLISAINA